MFRDSRLSVEETNTFWIQDIFISHPHQRGWKDPPWQTGHRAGRGWKAQMNSLISLCMRGSLRQRRTADLGCILIEYILFIHSHTCSFSLIPEGKSVQIWHWYLYCTLKKRCPARFCRSATFTPIHLTVEGQRCDCCSFLVSFFSWYFMKVGGQVNMTHMGHGHFYFILSKCG